MLQNQDYQFGTSLHATGASPWSNLTPQYATDAGKVGITTMTAAAMLAAEGLTTLPLGILPTDTVAKVTFKYSTNTSTISNYGATTLIGTDTATGSAGQVIAVATTVAPVVTDMVVDVNGTKLTPNVGFTYASGNVTIVAAQSAGATIKIFLAPYFLLKNALGATPTTYTGIDMTATRNVLFQYLAPQLYVDSIDAVKWGYADVSTRTLAGGMRMLLCSTASALTTDGILTGFFTQSSARTLSTRSGFCRPGFNALAVAPQMALNTAGTSMWPPAAAMDAAHQSALAIWGGWTGLAATGSFTLNSVKNVLWRLKILSQPGAEPYIYMLAVRTNVIPKKIPSIIITQDDTLISQYSMIPISAVRQIPISLAITGAHKVVPNTPDDCVFVGSISGTTMTVTSVVSGVISNTNPRSHITGTGVLPGTLVNTFGSGGTTGTGGVGTYQLSISQTVPAGTTMSSNLQFFTRAKMVEMFNNTFVCSDGVTRHAADGVIHGNHAVNGWADYNAADIVTEIDQLRTVYTANGMGGGNNFVVYPQNCWFSKTLDGQPILDVVAGTGITIGRGDYSQSIGSINPPGSIPTSKASIACIASINCGQKSTAGGGVVNGTNGNCMDANDMSNVVDLMKVTGWDVCLTYHDILANITLVNTVTPTAYAAQLDVLAAARNSGYIRTISAVEYGVETGYLPSDNTEGVGTLTSVLGHGLGVIIQTAA